MLAFKLIGIESRVPCTLFMADSVKPFILKLRPNALRLGKCCVWHFVQANPVWRANAGTACRGGGRTNPAANPATTTNLFRDMAQTS
jgi:hypothetical protein